MAPKRETRRFPLRPIIQILATGVCYYLATRMAWFLTFPDSKVSLFFPPHAILVSVLLLVPTRSWWAYVLAATSAHFFATQQIGWPILYALQAEVYDGVTAALTAACIRKFIKSRFDLIDLREAIIFVLVAVILIPVMTSFWGAAITYGYGSFYWLEWRNLTISNGVTTIVLVPAILIGAHKLSATRVKPQPIRVLEACLLAVSILVIDWIAFDRSPAGPQASAALLYSSVPLLIWAALRFRLGGISTAMVGITVMAIWGTMRGHGPFLAQTPQENALALQVFLLMTATPLMLLAVAIDDERRSKDALRVSEERMSLTMESAQLALWDWDVASDKIWITDAGRKFFGFHPDEPLHYANLAGLVHPDDAAVRETAILHSLATGSPYEAEYRIVLPDGSQRWILARGRTPSQHLNDVSSRILGVSMDNTRQKQANAEALEQREQLAHLSRVATVSALSSSIAHELSQPLFSILTNAQAGQRYALQNEPNVDELRAILDDIIRADRHAMAIIDRLRNMLRRGHVAFQPVNVNESLEELLHLTRSDLIARGVCVMTHTEVDLPPAMTDRVQLQQILLNLILNACDAMKSNQPGDRNITITTSIEENEIRIGVLDCGAGLPDDVEHLFQPFHSTKVDGLGMGLSICRTLVTAHGGRLWGEPRDERGAAFYVTLPLAKADASL